MKKRLDDLFDEASAKELDVVMENKDFSAPLDDDVLARIEKQTLEKSGLAAPRAKKRIVKRVLLLAATFALLLAVTLGTVACAAEQKEYREALKFFEEHNLSTEGLTRGEIKKVYRDITMQRFTYSKTAEVIQKSVWSQHLEGVEILQNDPTPEELEEIWERLKEGAVSDLSNRLSFFEVEADGDVRYESRRLGADEQYIECYDGDQLRWSIKLEPKYRSLEEIYPLGDGLLAEYMCDADMNDKRSFCQRLVRINFEGEIVWEYVMDWESELASVGCFDNDDGMISVLLRGSEQENGERNDYLIVKRFDANGEVLDSFRNRIGGMIRKVSRGENGFVLVVVDVDTEKTHIAVTDNTGRMMERFEYSIGKNYEIRDVIEYGGKIYFTADVTPTTEKGFREYAEKNLKDGGSDDKLLKLVREHYTATLMVCDPSDGVPKECYTQKGAVTGDLSISKDGVLIWDVKSIVTVEYSKMYYSGEWLYYLSGMSYIYQYAFDTDGKLLGQIQTERVEHFNI